MRFKFSFFILILLMASSVESQLLLAKNEFQLKPKYTIAQYIPFAFMQGPIDPCLGGTPPAIGSSCTSGTLYAGVFDGAKYMTTPGDCTDSATPTCDGSTDTLRKIWRGTSGSNVDIAGVENVTDEANHSSPSFRGDVNTAAIVADASIDSDSAADYCNNMSYGGYSDWYLPSKTELAYLICKANLPYYAGGALPEEAPDCTSLGGRTSEIDGFQTGDYYESSTEGSATNRWNVLTDWINFGNAAKSGNGLVRCVRRYDESSVDEVPDAISWSDFNDSSSVETITGFDETIFLQMSAVNGTGTPTLSVSINGGMSRTFDATAPAIVAVRSSYTLQFSISGSVSDSATITIRNATDDGGTPILDTVVATVSDPCIGGNPAIGTTCSGGAIYAGQFDGGKYMVTPGDCTDSATPTCDGTTDSLQKRWQGTSGSNADVAGLENLASNSLFSSPSLRGDVTTPIATADASVDSDSAADYCSNMTYSGYSDWYLPSLSEMTYIYCNSNISITDPNTQPQSDPNCVQFGGKTTNLTGFNASSRYLTTTEFDLASVWSLRQSGGVITRGKSNQSGVRCIRRFGEEQVDETTGSFWFLNFNDLSAARTIDGFDDTIFLEFSATNIVGTPTLAARVTSNSLWRTFTDGSPNFLAVRSGDQVEIRIEGSVGDQADITIINATDNVTRPTLDTVIATVSDPCVNNPAIGTNCSGGAIYAGQFDGGKYMVTPGNCTDSATPTCDGGNDSLTKRMVGTSGTVTNIAGVENVLAADLHSSPSFRGDVNTAARVADVNTDSDSAPDYCNDMTYGGYSDWYLPSKSEMAYIYCKSSTGSHNSSYPDEDPDCVQFGGKTSDLLSFVANSYRTSTEQGGASGWVRNSSFNGQFGWSNEANSGLVRCVRRYDESAVDEVPHSIDWADFNDVSSSETISGFDDTIFLELSAVNGTGTPTLSVTTNSINPRDFDATTPLLIAVRASDSVQFSISGNASDSATITIKNATDDATTPTLDTVVATVLDPCSGGNPAIGTTCSGGAVYAGQFDGGKYMITPGDCTNSATPTCDGTTDTLYKIWRGTGGSSADIPGVENHANNLDFTSPSIRGDVATAAIVADASVDSDSSADFCNDMTYGGHSDWYLPTINELAYIACNSNNSGSFGSSYPNMDPGCTQFGGKSTLLTNFDTNNYQTANESTGASNRKRVSFGNGSVAGGGKNQSQLLRCVRRFGEDQVDEVPNNINFSNFNDRSSAETIDGFDDTIFLEFSAVDGTGSPSLIARVVGGSVDRAFSDGSPNLLAVRSGDQIEIEINGTVGHSATVTIKNATDDASTPTLDTVVATVSDPCTNNPAIGTSCSGGAIFAGIFDGGKYMVTPGDCTDSATPTCDGTEDTLTKLWRGTSGSNVDVTGVENTGSNYNIHSSPSFRGDVNTAAIVADASISSDSAADYCNDMVYGGHSDWYLPSKSELAYIFCKSNQDSDSTDPDEDPNCVQFGGDTDDLTNFAGSSYVTSTQVNVGFVQRIHFGANGDQAAASKSGSQRVRCVRRYDEAAVDEAPYSFDFANFNDTSAAETISGFDETIFFELSSSSSVGTPSYYVRTNSGDWKLFDDSNPLLIAVRDSDSLELRIIGNVSDSGTITIKNATDDATTPTLDTVVATVSDLCGGVPTIGSTCGGGALFAGVFDGGKYMVTPGDCTDSSTPTCDGTEDTLDKVWRGTSGSDVDIAGVETMGFGNDYRSSSPLFRGDVNTAAAVADASIDSDSALDYCNDMDYGGYQDWYLPSKSELAYMLCKSSADPGANLPGEAPNCTQFGGESDEIPGFATYPTYQSSTEYHSSWVAGQSSNDLNSYAHGKSGAVRVRCIRRYDEFLVDSTLATNPDWSDFNDNSTAETLSGFDETIFLELSAVNDTGTPEISYQINSDNWIDIDVSDLTYVPVRSGDTLGFRVTGTATHAATITIKHGTGGSVETIDTVTGTVVAPCNGDPAVGTSCSGGALYAGQFDGGKYMITPGDCTDSATPTCDGTEDTLNKVWRGTSGSAGTVTGLEEVATSIEHSSPSDRGDVGTPIIVADATIDSDSAADFCNDMTYGGYSDWYLPSKSEFAYISCHTDAIAGSDVPLEDPGCSQFSGGQTDLLTGFSGDEYSTATQVTGNSFAAWFIRGGGNTASNYKGTARKVRCVRRYDEAAIDESPNPIDYLDFNDESFNLTFNGFDATIFLEFSASNLSGAPTFIVLLNGSEYKTFSDGSSTLVAVRSGDQIQMQVTGSVTNSATVTIRNATDDASTPILDTAVGTVSDVCQGTPTLGTTCGGGAIYAGIFDGGKYMITDGDCTDSATPTCDGSTDSLDKRWRGTSGSDADVAGAETVSSLSQHSSPSFRGDVNTAAIVADASVSSDSGADYCNDMTYGGYDDWYLPSKSELMYMICKSNVDPASGEPVELPNCTQVGGATDDLLDFETTRYMSSTEFSSSAANVFLGGASKAQGSFTKSNPVQIRCIRRYQSIMVDDEPDAIAWIDFSHHSSVETFTGFDETIFIELTASNGTGSPTLEYQRNSEGWVTFTAGSSTLVAVRSGDTLEFQATGTAGDDATITIKNATDDANQPTLDTVVATVDICGGNPAIGSTCAGGALYAGIFDGGKYMVTPGDCTDSATPTCDGTQDSLSKVWRGTTGSNSDIAGVETMDPGSEAVFSSPLYRGDVNTAAMVADASVSSDSSGDYCNDMTYGGYDDWYLPSIAELTYIACKASGTASTSAYPQSSPNCTQFGGEADLLTGFESGGAVYQSSTEETSSRRWGISLNDTEVMSTSKSNNRRVRCVRRYDESKVDEAPDTINWADFDDSSTIETFTGFDETIFIELTASNNTGTPTLQYRLNANAWTTFAAGSSTLVAVRPNDSLQFQVSGTSTHAATITIKNLTDDVSTPTLDTVVATVSDPCGGDPTIGTTCTGGALYAGVFDGGKYMVTPGNCTDSATPTCNGARDSLTKTWRGSAGSNADIAGVEGLSESEFSSPNSRGAGNTTAIVANVNTGSDSAADYCENMTYGGYSDWFLPSKSELGHIYCHAWSTNHLTTRPEMAPDCTQYGGKSTELTDFDDAVYFNTTYWSSNESSSNQTTTAQFIAFWDGNIGSALKSESRRVRCIRRYDESLVDKTPSAIAWSDFTGTSTAETLSDFYESIFLEISAVNDTGTPTLEYQINSDGWNAISTSESTYILVRDGDTLQFRATGTTGHAGTITVKNATDDATTPTLDTVTATVP